MLHMGIDCNIYREGGGGGRDVMHAIENIGMLSLVNKTLCIRSVYRYIQKTSTSYE